MLLTRPWPRYLNNILEKALLAPDESYMNSLRAMFEIILQFSTTQDTLYASALEQNFMAKREAEQVSVSRGLVHGCTRMVAWMCCC